MRNNKFNPKVSIVIPVYNGSNYLKEAIDSALAQTYKNIEVIVINDGSNDNNKTDRICKSYGNKIRYFRKENGGVASALNMGIEKMKGEYFSWLSHDDVYYPEKVEKQIEALSDISNKNPVIIYSGFEFMDENGKIITTFFSNNSYNYEKLNNPYYPILKGILHGCTLLIPKKCFEEIGIFDTRLKATQDYDLWLKMFPSYKIIFVPEILVKSRIHSEQGSKKIPVAKKEANKLWKQIVKNVPEKEIIKLFGTKKAFYASTLEIVRSGGYTRAEKYILELDKQIDNVMEFNPKVSIIIPVYNGANYMKEAIDSALAQTYNNIEIIVINDGSNDEGATHRIAKSYGKKIRYFSKENGGTSSALNVGIRNMKGEYFSWLSHDDLYYPEKIQRQIEELNKLEDKNTIMMTDLDGIDENYNKIYQTDYMTHMMSYPPRLNSNIYPIVYNQTHGCTLLIPKKCFDELGLFNEMERVAQDFEFFYRAFLKFPHKLIPEVLVTARDSSNRQGKRSKARGNTEYSNLYIKIIKNLSDEEIELLAPTKVDFYNDMYEFFDYAGYTYAREFIKEKVFKNLQISSYDLIGNKFNGHDLHFYLRENLIDSKQFVLHKESNDKDTIPFDFLAKDSTMYLFQLREFYDTDIVHLHLVHNILDLNYLPMITRLKPTVITLHDPFFLGGHCVHHFDCKKWQSHCKDCPYLDEVFCLTKDYSSLNFELKKQAIQNSQITAIVASKWMERKVKKSPIWANKKVYLLPFGINQNLFKPSDRDSAKKKLNIEKDSIVLMLRANNGPFKGLDIIVNALSKIKTSKKITLITVDQKGLLDKFKDKYNILEYDWVKDDNFLVTLYQACDIFLMPSRQETFGMMAIEAMSCGKMVLAVKGEGTALPEVIDSPKSGIAVDETEFSTELQRLINHPEEMELRGKRSLKFAQKMYSKDVYVSKMITIYKEVMADHQLDDDSKLILKQLKKHMIKESRNIDKGGDSDKERSFSINNLWKEQALTRKIYRKIFPIRIRRNIKIYSRIIVSKVAIFVPRRIKEKLKNLILGKSI